MSVSLFVLYKLNFFFLCRYFFIKLHKHLRDKEFQLIMIHLRSVYKFGLEDSQAQGYKLCSERGSLAATLEEVTYSTSL